MPKLALLSRNATLPAAAAAQTNMVSRKENFIKPTRVYVIC
jgi:hypothetical protein